MAASGEEKRPSASDAALKPPPRPRLSVADWCGDGKPAEEEAGAGTDEQAPANAAADAKAPEAAAPAAKGHPPRISRQTSTALNWPPWQAQDGSTTNSQRKASTCSSVSAASMPAPLPPSAAESAAVANYVSLLTADALSRLNGQDALGPTFSPAAASRGSVPPFSGKSADGSEATGPRHWRGCPSTAHGSEKLEPAPSPDSSPRVAEELEQEEAARREAAAAKEAAAAAAEAAEAESSDEEIILESEGTDAEISPREQVPKEAAAEVAEPSLQHRMSSPAAYPPAPADAATAACAAAPAATETPLLRRMTLPPNWAPSVEHPGGMVHWKKVLQAGETEQEEEPPPTLTAKVLAEATALAEAKALEEAVRAAQEEEPPMPAALSSPPPKGPPAPMPHKQAPKVPHTQPPPKCPPSPKKAAAAKRRESFRNALPWQASTALPPKGPSSLPSPKLGVPVAAAPPKAMFHDPGCPGQSIPPSPAAMSRALELAGQRGGPKVGTGSRPRSKSPPRKSRSPERGGASVRQRSQDSAREGRSPEQRHRSPERRARSPERGARSPESGSRKLSPQCPDLRLQVEKDLSRASEILPWLFLGSNLTAESSEELTTSAGITHVLNLAKECSLDDEVRDAVENYNSERGLRFVYKKYPLGDSGTQDLLDQLPEALNFIDAAHQASPRHHVLVHCARGNSRSTAVVLAYLVQFEGLSLLAAYERLAASRAIAMPHRPFLGCLGLLECELLGRAVPSLTGGEDWARPLLSEEERAAIRIQALVRGRLGRALAAVRREEVAAMSPPRVPQTPTRLEAGKGKGRMAQQRTPSPDGPQGRGVATPKRFGGKKAAPGSPQQGRRGLAAGANVPGSPQARRLPCTPEKADSLQGVGPMTNVEGEDPLDADSELHPADPSSPSRPTASSPSRPFALAEEPAVNRFLAALRERRGTVLRSFLMDLDRRNCGRISNFDLAAACRSLGYSKEAKIIWNSLRSENALASLRLQDFDAEEAANLEQFASVLWAEAGLDLDRAWARIDPGNRMFVTSAEFERGVRKLGFQGNSFMLFGGLDINGLGHLRRRDFDALERLVPVAERLEGNDSEGITHLRAWARKMHKGIPMLLAELGLAGGKDCGILEVGDLAARLVEVGYPKGMAASTAAAVASSGGYPGGSHITGSALKALLAGAKPAEIKPAKAPPSAATRVTSPLPLTTPRISSPRKMWSDSYGNTSLANTRRTCHTRTYFSTAGSVRWGSPSPPSPPLHTRSPAVASVAPATAAAAAAPSPPVPMRSHAGTADSDTIVSFGGGSLTASVSTAANDVAPEVTPASASSAGPASSSEDAAAPAPVATAPQASQPAVKTVANGSVPENNRIRPGSLSPERGEKEVVNFRASMPSLRSSHRDSTGRLPGTRPTQRLSTGSAR